MANIILNDTTNTKTGENKDIDRELKTGINNLKGNFYDLETGGVNYPAMKGSEPYEEYKAITAQLKDFDLKSLKTRETKLAFWINIYNSLVVHGIVQMEVKKTIKEISHFFESVSYNIGGHTFSLDDIEHGILRGNIKKHLFARRPFSSNDPRKEFILETLEPRIHFCLVCGSKSCPPIGTYQEDKIDQQLDMAAGSFINGEDIIIEKNRNKLRLSRIFKWYKQDFGNDEELIRFIAKYRRNIEEKEFLEKNARSISLSFNDYDWNLNH